MIYLTAKMRKEGPNRMHANDRIPQRQSNYTVLSAAMEVRWDDIPNWISCPPAVILDSDFQYIIGIQETSHSIWTMAVTENEVLYSSVSALSIKVNP